MYSKKLNGGLGVVGGVWQCYHYWQIPCLKELSRNKPYILAVYFPLYCVKKNLTYPDMRGFPFLV